MAKMDLNTLKTIIQAEINNSIGVLSTGSELSEQLERSMNYYLGEPFGNEIEGRSKVVLTTVADTIEWVMPSLMKTFAGGDEVVRFDPQYGPDDEKQAEQETDVVNHIFYKENPGFLILYSWIKDALLSKNGLVDAYWEEKEDVEEEYYEGLTTEGLNQLLADEEVEAVEHTVEIDVQQTPMGPMQVELHSVKIKRTVRDEGITIDPFPPEEFLISRRARDIYPKNAPFCARRTRKTISDLVKDGFDYNMLKNIGSTEGSDTNEVTFSRYNLNDEQYFLDDTPQDPSMRELDVYTCFIQVDYDGDNKAELRRIIYAGNEILENEVVHRCSYHAITPIILTHKFHGLSLADLLMDLQLIQSTILRQILDNMYLANNQRTAVDENNVNLDDLLVSRPGGIVRTKGNPAENVMPMVTPSIATNGFQMLEYLDSVKTSRTGVSPNTQGQNFDLAGDTAHGIERMMTAAEAKIELIARVIAETGVKDLFLHIHELLQKNSQQEKTLQVRGEWVQVDPQSWRKRNRMTVKVGLGTGDRTKMQMALRDVIDQQEQAIAGGGMGILVTPENIYNAKMDYAKYSGLTSIDKYWADPKPILEAQAQQPKQPPPPDPTLEAIAAQKEIEAGKAAIAHEKNQLQAQKQDRDTENNMLKLQQQIAEFQAANTARLTELELKYKMNVPGALV